MTTKINIKFRASSIAEDKGVICYQVEYNQVACQVASDLKIYPYEWSEADDFIVVDNSDVERAKQLRVIIDQIGFETRRLYRLAKELDSRDALNQCDDIIFEYRKQPKIPTFYEYISSQIAQLEKDNKLGTANNYTSAFNSFLKFRDGEDIILDSVTPSLIEKYDAYLKRENVSNNSVSFYMRNLRAIYNKAVKEGLVSQQSPFQKVYTGVEKTMKQTLSVKEIKLIKEYEGITNSTCAFARDIFLFSFYTRGMSFVDIANLQKVDIVDGVLIYRKRKKGQPFYIKWEQCMQEIVDRYDMVGSPYLFPIIGNAVTNANYYKNELGKVNNWLKRLSKDLKLGVTLTMNVARSSWALAAKNKNIPLSIISESLGYNDDTATKLYLESLDGSIIDRANSLVVADILND